MTLLRERQEGNGVKKAFSMEPNFSTCLTAINPTQTKDGASVRLASNGGASTQARVVGLMVAQTGVSGGGFRPEPNQQALGPLYPHAGGSK
jgi:hypothetical protein